MLPPLITDADVTRFHGTAAATVEAIDRASTRVRGHLGQQVSDGTSTVVARGPVFRLPERPVRSVTSVTCDGEPVAYELEGSILTVNSLDVVTVTYDHGYVAGTLPDPLVEMIAQLAVRLTAPVDPAMAAGVQQQDAGPFTTMFGMDAWQGQAGLTSAEKRLLARYWPRLPNPISIGRP